MFVMSVVMCDCSAVENVSNVLSSGGCQYVMSLFLFLLKSVLRIVLFFVLM